jgi:twitching motility protein PilT
MKSDLVQRLVQKNYLELQFRLGHKILGKKNKDWEEIDYKEMNLSEWEDLKDLCLNKNEKINLETTGFAKGISNLSTLKVIFSFMEWKENFKAHVVVSRDVKINQFLQNLTFWESVRKPAGLHLVAGRSKSGKSQFLAELIDDIKRDSPQMCATHSDISPLRMISNDTLMHFGIKSLTWSKSHPIYDGVDRLFVDINDLLELEKWIEFAEQGRWVVLTLNAANIQNALEQVYSRLSQKPYLWKRFCYQISSVIYLAAVTEKDLALFESLTVTRKIQRMMAESFNGESVQSISEMLTNEKSAGANTVYQSLNQSILQALLKRQLDVSLAFQHSNDPELLDQMLKKMGL